MHHRDFLGVWRKGGRINTKGKGTWGKNNQSMVKVGTFSGPISPTTKGKIEIGSECFNTLKKLI